MDRRGPASTLEDISHPPGQSEIRTRRASLGERVALGIALWAASIGVGVPAIAFLWIAAVSLTTSVTAEALEHTHGLEETTFGGGYWLAMGVNAVIVLWSVVRRVRKQPAPWKPLALLAVTYLALIWVTVVPELVADLGIPDVLTTFALLGADSLASYVFPVLLSILLLRGMRHLWFVGQRSSVAAQQIGIATTCLGLGCMTLAAGLLVVDVEPKSLDVAVEEFTDSLDVEGVKGELQGYEALSLALGSGLSRDRDAAASQSAFGACAERLAEPQFDSVPVLEEATKTLMRKGLDKADAEDVAMDTLVRVCMEHARRGIDDPVRYYFAALRNHANNFRRRSGRSEVLDEAQVPDETIASVVSRMELDGDLETLLRAMARLSASDQHVLELRYVDGLDYGEIGIRLAKNEVAARQQVKRARDRLEKAWRREDRRLSSAGR
jgi:RNA polymerase sigma factor (sigma-70 family)